jgi:hypothetical protein
LGCPCCLGTSELRSRRNKKILFFARSAGFEHPPVIRHGDERSVAERPAYGILHVILVQETQGMTGESSALASQAVTKNLSKMS